MLCCRGASDPSLWKPQDLRNVAQVGANLTPGEAEESRELHPLRVVAAGNTNQRGGFGRSPLWMQRWHQEMWPPRLCSPLQSPGDHYKSSGTTGLRWQTTLQGTAGEVQKHVGSFPNLPTQKGHQIQAGHKSLQLFARGVRVLQQRHLSAPRVAKQWREDAAQICLRSLAWKPWCIFVT